MTRGDDISVYCLASGSSGNALLLTTGQDSLLLDAGLGIRTIKREMELRGVCPSTLRGIFLTHEHIDHVRGAIPLARKYNAPLISSPGTLQMLFAQTLRDAPHAVLEPGNEAGWGPFGVRAVPVSHDAAQPVGFRVSVGDFALAYATDTGKVTPEFEQACHGVSLLVVESNHDAHKLRFGPYPDYLKKRIGGEFGHLSNQAACDLVLAHTHQFGPLCVWLSHLSQTNNTPRMALNYWKKRYKAEGLKTSPAHVEVALRDTPSLVYQTRSRAVQLALF